MFVPMRPGRLISLVLVTIELTFLVLVIRTLHPVWTPMRIAGICLLLFAFAWARLARYQLGRSFSVTPQARQLVTSGIYSRIRNPIYLATPFLVIGLSLTLARWWPMLLLVILVPM